ncbi:unnamed protein product, partial [Discosporangium mesarthrocarpum]
FDFLIGPQGDDQGLTGQQFHSGPGTGAGAGAEGGRGSSLSHGCGLGGAVESLFQAAQRAGVVAGSQEWAAQCLVHGRILSADSSTCKWFPLLPGRGGPGRGVGPCTGDGGTAGPGRRPSGGKGQA